jgi:putative oxidoreductase
MKTIFDWIIRITAALILFQTLFFKFKGAEESIYIFSTLGIEPWGRYFIATAELVCVVMLLVPQTVVFGALLSLGVIAGAIFAHLTKLGIEVEGDGGLLFYLAVSVFVGCGILLLMRRVELVILRTSLITRLKSIGK